VAKTATCAVSPFLTRASSFGSSLPSSPSLADCTWRGPLGGPSPCAACPWVTARDAATRLLRPTRPATYLTRRLMCVSPPKWSGSPEPTAGSTSGA
jgi:hypothetical protein